MAFCPCHQTAIMHTDELLFSCSVEKLAPSNPNSKCISMAHGVLENGIRSTPRLVIPDTKAEPAIPNSLMLYFTTAFPLASLQRLSSPKKPPVNSGCLSFTDEYIDS